MVNSNATPNLLTGNNEHCQDSSINSKDYEHRATNSYISLSLQKPTMLNHQEIKCGFSYIVLDPI